VLQQVLERAELSKLPKPVQGKLERFLADQQSEIDGLRARHERFKVDSGECGGRGRPRAGREPFGRELGGAVHSVSLGKRSPIVGFFSFCKGRVKAAFEMGLKNSL